MPAALASESVLCLLSGHNGKLTEFVFRDAKQFTGLEDCQSRTAKKLYFHFNSSLTALNLAKLQAWQSRDPNQPFVFSMASIKRRALNQFLLDAFISKLERSPTLIKFHPNYCIFAGMEA